MDQQARLQHGAFSWNELLTSDTSGAKAFYSELFGWTLHDEHIHDTTYTFIKDGDNQVGGIFTTPAEMGNMPPTWGCYVTVDDVDKQVTKAEQLGGKIILHLL